MSLASCPKKGYNPPKVSLGCFTFREENLGSELSVQVSGNQVILRPPGLHDSSSGSLVTSTPPADRTAKERKGAHKFTFDYAYWSHDAGDAHFANQAKVFRDLGTGVVDNAFNGYNVCVFAYGQTGSGKTYTMMGQSDAPVDHAVDESNDGSDRGLIPRICSSLFRKMQQSSGESSSSGGTYRTEVSYLEIYNESVRDLLNAKANAQAHKLKLREHPKDGPYVENLTKHLVVNYRDILALMERGNKVRTTASTNMNDTSSRSHAIFTITFVNAGYTDGLPHETVSKIHLVDLAGSERADATGATGQRLKEGAHINKSLVTLGSVISALSEAASGSMNSSMNSSMTSPKKPFIPYRDSTLTWLLKDSLGGNAKTIMIATVSPAEINHGETLSTLRYANRAKNIINKPTINEDVNVKLIRELRAEIERLRSVMETDPSCKRKLEQKEAQERTLTEEWTEKWKEAAKILKEQSALALKRTGWGVVLDSDKPHLVGIDEDVLSTGITLYHFKDGGETKIGADPGSDIILRGANVMASHCVITLQREGDKSTVTLKPCQGAFCIVNGATITSPLRLSQGCVIILGKTNMFRYNDPKEAASMRLNLNNKRSANVVQNNKLLSQSLSDLRAAELSVFSEEEEELDLLAFDNKDSKKLIDNAKSNSNLLQATTNNNKSVINEKCSVSEQQPKKCDEAPEVPTRTATSSSSSLTSSRSSEVATPESGRAESASGFVHEEMAKLYEQIANQKEIVMQCLESETSDVAAMEEQVSALQTLQNKYIRMEFDHARSLWMKSAGSGSESDDYESTFSRLVEQEVDKRLLQEKLLRSETEYQERELIRIQKERELAQIKREHEREIYLLRRKLHEAKSSEQLAPQLPTAAVVPESRPFDANVTIPSFRMSSGPDSYIEYVIWVRTGGDGKSWCLHRRFRQFRVLHVAMCQTYGQMVTTISFPARRIFGNKSCNVAQERRQLLQRYLNTLIQSCAEVGRCPLYQNPTKPALIKFAAFFEQCSDDKTPPDSGPLQP